MSRASRRDNAIAASLFPFLAVLLCTMGVLVVLLAVMVSVQRDQAASTLQAERASHQALCDSPEQRKLREQLTIMESRERQFQQARQQAADKLHNEQQRLSRIEENIRRWQDRLAKLRVEIQELHELDGQAHDDEQQAAKELQRRHELIAEVKAEIDALKQQHSSRQKSYALIPYSGENGTKRRPIYIECRRGAVILQPEGIELTPRDFNRLLRAGAPLPAAIRAVQQYYVDERIVDEQPYPLLIVRPDASGAFVSALQSLEYANADFGYEIIDADWKLDFGAANPALSGEIQLAIDNARARIDALERNAPGDFAKYARESFEPGPSPVEQLRSGTFASALQAIGVVTAPTHSTPVLLSGNSTELGRLAEALEAAVNNGGVADVSPAASTSSAFTEGSSTGAGHGESGNLPGNRPPHPEPGGHASLAASGPSASDGTSDRQSEQGARPSPEAPDGSSNNAATSADPASRGAVAANGSPSQSGQQGGDSAGAASGTSTQAMSAISEAAVPAGSGSASLVGSQSGVALVRELRVKVYPTQLVVQTQRQKNRSRSGQTSPGAIPLDGNFKAVAHRFVTTVQEEVRDWGIAGEGLYWQPVLQLDVAPGGERVAQKLAAALKQSGVEVRLAKLP